MIKTWMNDSLRSKVHFTKTLDDLERFIPRSNIPPDLGGTDDTYEYHYMEPDMNDRAENLSLDVHSPTREFLAAQRERIAGDLLEATRLWLQTIAMRDGIGLAVQEDRRAELIEELRLNFWRLDPFTRARCQLDREGIIVSDGIGTIDFYPHLRAAERRGTDVSMERGGEAVTSPSPLPSRLNRISNGGGAGLGLLSPSSSTLDSDKVEVVDNKPVQPVKTRSKTPFPRDFLDDASIISNDSDGHDHDHDESSIARDEIMQEYMDDNYEYYDPHHRLPYEQEQQQQQYPSRLPVTNPATQKESDIRSELSFNLEDLDEEDEDIEIHDAVTQRIPYPRGGGIVQRAAVRVVNVR